jgi:hypothetical protein
MFPERTEICTQKHGIEITTTLNISHKERILLLPWLLKCLSGLLNADIYADSNLLCMKVARNLANYPYVWHKPNFIKIFRLKNK